MSSETIELQLESPGTGPQQYQPETPGLFVVSAVEDVTGVDGMVSPESQQVLRDLDYDRHLAVIAFHGQIGTTGYGIEVKRVARQEGTISVYTELIRPEPDQLLGLMVTSPYHVVHLNRSNLDSPETLSFLFYTNGRLVDKQKVSIR